MKIRFLTSLVGLVIVALLISCGREPATTLPRDSMAQDFPTKTSDTQSTGAVPQDSVRLPEETRLMEERSTAVPIPVDLSTPEPPPENLPTSEHPLESLPTIFNVPVSTNQPEISMMRTSVITQTAVQVAAGERFACVLTQDNFVKCWGNNQYGQLGNGGSEGCPQGLPQPYWAVSGLYSTIQSIDAGWYHACALMDNRLMCWGRNNTGQLGDGTRNDRCQANPVVGIGNILRNSPKDTYALGGYHTCAMDTDGKLMCWGDGYRGQLGNGTSGTGAFSATPVEVSGLGGIQQLAAGAWHTCALTWGGGVWCWGDNSYGQIGDGNGAYGVYATTPVEVNGLSSGVQTIAAGGNHTCAVLKAGGIKCWGDNDYGQMGIGSYGGYYSKPVPVNGLRNVSVDEIEAGGNHTCVRFHSAGNLLGFQIPNSGVICWGFNYYGQLGNGQGYSYGLTPVNVLNLDCGVKDISAGDFFTCAALYNGSLKCWGRNDDGQLGYGGWDHQYQPKDVLGFEEPLIYKICGYVVDKNNPKKKIYGVEINTSRGRKTLTSPFNWWFETGTSKFHSGGFCFCRLEADTHTLTPTRTGLYFSPDLKNVQVPPNQDDGTIKFEAEPIQTFILSGRVLDTQGNPVEGVKIESISGDSTYTIAGGWYSLPLDMGSHTITPSKGGYRFTDQSVIIDLSSDRTLDFEAIPPFPTTRGSQSFEGGQANGSSVAPSLSADGRYVAFSSTATNLVEDDNNVSCTYIGYGYPPSNCGDVFVFDRQTGETTLVSVSSNGVQANLESNAPSISADGRIVAFTSDASNLVDGDTNNVQDIFVHDLQTGLTRRVSVASDGTQANGSSGRFLSDQFPPSISADGRWVAFFSYASNLVEGDTNGKSDIFVHDLETGETRRVSVNSAGQQVYDHSDNPVISADGRYVVFESVSIHLVNRDTNGYQDIFLHDLQTGQTTLVSVAPDGTQANRASYDPFISGDGRLVVFYTDANNLTPNMYNKIIVHDTQTGQNTGIFGGSYWPTISADGRYVSFTSTSSYLVSGDTNQKRDAFVYDLQTGEISLISMSSEGVQGNDHVSENYHLFMSADGSIVAYASDATNLVSGAEGYRDVYVAEWPWLPVLVAPTPTPDTPIEYTEKVYLPIVVK